MSRNPSIALLVLALLVAGPARAGSIKQVVLDQGRTDENRIVTPVFDASDAPGLVVGEIASGLDPGLKVVSRLGWGRVPDPTLGQAIQVGDLLAQAMRSEGVALGLPVTEDGAGAWRVSGRVDDLALKVRVIMFGPLVFYGYLEATFTVTGPEGESAERTYRVFNLASRYNAGMGMEDEVSETLAQLFVEAGQEVMSRLNRDLFHLPPRPGIAERARTLAGQDVDGRESELRTVGLSLAPDAVAPLLALLESERDEGDRVHVLDALANLGSPEAVPVLIRRFAGEETECRYATLDALQTLGGEEALRFVREEGARDGETSVQLVAERVR